jgi:hypothetical protein
LDPHDELDSLESASHEPALQQPAHELLPQPQAPPEHAWPEAHEPHAAPAVPQALDDCDAYGTHALPLQQPLGHDVALQTHWPVLVSHCCPDAHAVQPAPAVPQEAAD